VRKTELCRQIVGLVEPPAQLPPWVKRYRRDDLDPAQQIGARRAHHRAERHGEAAPPFVLECVKDLAKRASILARGARDGDNAAVPAAPRTAFGASRPCSPGGKRIAAALAQRRHDQSHPVPALAADRALERCVQDAAAGGAGRDDDCGNECV
jgi:hypothetical protein